MKLNIVAFLLVLTFTAPLMAADDPGAGQEDNQVASEAIQNDQGSPEAAKDKLDIKVDSLKRRILEKIEQKIAQADLSDEEREALEDELSDMKDELDELGNGRMKINISSDGDESFMEFVVAIVAIVLIFGTPFLIVAAVLFSSYRKRKLMHDTITMYVSSGKDVPPEVISSLESSPVSKRSNLHKGLVMSGIGIGVFLCFMIIGSMSAASLGLIPLFIGLAQLLIWRLEERDSGEHN